MEIMLRIPDELYRYIEFIPKSELPEIFIDLIRKGIESGVSDGNKVDIVKDSSLELQSILSAIKQLGETSFIQNRQEAPDRVQNITEFVEKKSADFHISKVMVDNIEDDESDFDDFMDLMK